MTVYRVIPVGDTKCIKLTFHASRQVDNITSTVTIRETYESGFGIIEVGSVDELPATTSETITCDPLLGWSLYKCQSVPFIFEFSDDMSPEERSEFENLYKTGDGQGKIGAGWVHEGDNLWSIDNEELIVYGPVTFEEIVIQDPPSL